MHFGDTIFIFLLALVVFGPKKLPEIGRQIGKLMVEFRRASNDFKLQIEEELRSAEQAERQKALAARAAEAAATAVPSGEPSILPPSEGSTVSYNASPEGNSPQYNNYNNEAPSGAIETGATEPAPALETTTSAEAQSGEPVAGMAAVDDPVAEAAIAGPLISEQTEGPGAEQMAEPVSPNAERYYTNGSVEVNGATPAHDEEPAQDQAPIHHV